MPDEVIGLTVKDIRAMVATLTLGRPLGDSGRRKYQRVLAYDVEVIRVIDPVNNRWIGDVSLQSFIDIAIEMLNEKQEAPEDTFGAY